MDIYSRYLLYRVERDAAAAREHRGIPSRATTFDREFPHLRAQLNMAAPAMGKVRKSRSPRTLAQSLRRAARRLRHYRLTTRVADEH